ncbi:lysozyme inhibitor LprI family protein [Cupriavidus sp. IDO]|uniref:lysozyme inhibitor LprI family protein n=1 Tax=Cupriavidus sp. IDO TaxID=1539142 RepID=UPI000578FF18|nr:lysozyme inhibitor LprI family protein [Cupriavidus sp. IDO]KWR90884.1 hypothetical protein RM96_07110 [Cupriavidus sp. IDO]
MKRGFLCLSLAVVVGLPFAARAEDSGLTKQFDTCMNKAGGVTAGMIDCIDGEAQRQDARLNKAYKALMGGLQSERKKQLQDAQRNWIKFRDTNCSFYYDPDGGTMARVSANDCVMTMTASRAKELENLRQQ